MGFAIMITGCEIFFWLLLSMAAETRNLPKTKLVRISDVNRFRELRVPVLLQIGTESPRDLYVTDAIAAVLPDVRIEELPGQAHEGMTTAPQMYAEAVSRFLH
jgi:pimeloyl-ACP methyl ester carboxylesterase